MDPNELATGFGALRIQLVAFAILGLFVRVAEVELWVISLRLEHLGPLHELPGFSTMRRLMLTLTCGRLILPVPVLVAHRSVRSQGMFQFFRPMQPVTRVAAALLMDGLVDR